MKILGAACGLVLLEMYIVVITIGINLQRGSVEGIVVVEARALLTYSHCVDN